MNTSVKEISKNPRWSAAQHRMFVREAARRTREAGQGMRLPPGYVDPYMPQPTVNNSRPGTLAHIAEVRRLIGKMLRSLAQRSLLHDQSKLEDPEVAGFDQAAHRLAGCAYDSEEYRAGLAALRPALAHHYAVNSHHPEHYSEGIRGMCLMDLAEMLCDWMAACQRSPDGQILSSLDKNQARFGYGDELKQILLNTVQKLYPQEAARTTLPGVHQ